VREGRKAKLRILLAEDNITNQLVALKILEKLGYRVDAVADGKEVLSSLGRLPYDLVLMDCQMPEMDGYEATRHIRKNEVKGMHIPVIAMTANALAGDREKCLDAGMDDYLSKPVEPTKIAAILDRWLTKGDGNIDDVEELEGDDPSPTQSDGDVKVSFDRKGFLSRVQDDDDFARVLITAFLQDMPLQIETLTASIAAGDVVQAGKQAHKIKGAAANMGGEAMCESAGAMESVGKAGNLDALKRLLPVLRENYKELRGRLEAF